MKEHFLGKSDTDLMNTLLNLKEEDGVSWQAEDLAPIWELLLDTPVESSLRESMPGATELLQPFEGAATQTFGALFQDPEPPIELLRLVKNFAKEQGTRIDALLPEEICSVLYQLCIFLAEKTGGVRISDLGGDELAGGLAWIRIQPWIDDATKALLD